MTSASSRASGRSVARGFGVATIVLALMPAAPALAQPDFSGAWQVARSDDVIRPDEDLPNLTDTARARRDTYETKFVANGIETGNICYTPGMPWMMLSKARNYLYEIYQAPDRIVVTYEPMDQFRQIYLDGRKFPDKIEPSRNGYSIGHFEGDVLKVETRGLNPTNTRAATKQRGAGAVIHEEWRIEKDPASGELLVIDVTVDDKEIYRAPGRGKEWLKRADAGATAAGYNCPEAVWDDLVEKTLGPAAP